MTFDLQQSPVSTAITKNFNTQNPGLNIRPPDFINDDFINSRFGFLQDDLGDTNNNNFFSRDGGAGLVLSGLQTIGTLFNSFQQNKLAKKSFEFQKDAFNTNLKFNVKQANNSLEDRIRARFATEGRSEQADAKIAEQRLVI